MKHAILAGALLTALAVGCLDGTGTRSGMPQPGDVVSPTLIKEVLWEPGEKVKLQVELTATDPDGRVRRLGFGASPKNNPVAHLTFYDAAGEVVGTVEKHISHRC